MKVLGTSFIDSMPSQVGLLIYGSFQFFGWPSFLILGVIYTAVVYSGLPSKGGPLILSKRNARPLSVILGIHLAFLMILMGLFILSSYIESSLPKWLTDESLHGRGMAVSAFEILFIVAMGVMCLIEWRWLSVDSEADDSEPEDDPS
jgi:hypothetical protein